jgi:transcriptional regulator with XRE-family HTH domain
VNLKLPHEFWTDMTKQSRSPTELRSMFGENLRTLSRRYASISELARQLGINRTQLNRYLSGESFPRPDVLDRICRFFAVDARILLEPVQSLASSTEILNGPFLKDYVGFGLSNMTDETFPIGFYRFSRRSFANASQFIVGLVYVFRDHGSTYVRGYEAKDAMRQQGLPTEAPVREFRGYLMQQEDGIALVISRQNAKTCSFNYLARVASFENNFWVGYATRTVREGPTGTRATRMVYEYLGRSGPAARLAARDQGYKSEDELMVFHRQLLQANDPFR